jgi:ribose transport system substrate-binding protein
MRKAYLAWAAAACLACAGCGGSRETYKYRITVIPKGMTHEFWQSIHRGSERAAADLKAQRGLAVQVHFQGPAREDEAQPQIDIINHAVAQNASGVVLAPQHSQTMVAPVEAARGQNVPVLIIDSGLANPDVIVKYIATDNYHGGVLAAEQLLKALAARGKMAPRIVLFRYKRGSESTEQREKGFEDTVNKAIAERKAKGEPTITWVSKDLEMGATQDEAQANSRPLLSDKGDQIDGIFAVNESSASGVVESLRSLGLNKKIVLVGFDSSGPLQQAVRDGDVEALIVQDPYRMGYLGVYELVLHLEGYNVTPGGKKVESTGEYVVTKENLDAPATRELFDPEAQAKRTLKVPEYAK